MSNRGYNKCVRCGHAEPAGNRRRIEAHYLECMKRCPECKGFVHWNKRIKYEVGHFAFCKRRAREEWVDVEMIMESEHPNI